MKYISIYIYKFFFKYNETLKKILKYIYRLWDKFKLEFYVVYFSTHVMCEGEIHVTKNII